MNNRLNEILNEIKALEKSVQEEIKRKEEEFRYTIRKRKSSLKMRPFKFRRPFPAD